MKYCRECKRMSKYDDFCSHCGVAVYGDDDVKSDISCTTQYGHSHSEAKQTQDKRVIGIVLALLVFFPIVLPLLSGLVLFLLEL